MRKIILTLMLIFYTPYILAQEIEVVIYAKHVLDIKTKNKIALYDFDIKNISYPNLNNFTIGYIDSYPDGKDILQFDFMQLFASKKLTGNWMSVASFNLPPLWTGEVVRAEGDTIYGYSFNASNATRIYDIPIGKSNKQMGWNVSIKIPRADPDYAKSLIQINYPRKKFTAKVFDTSPPNIIIQLLSYDGGNVQTNAKRHGWIEVEADVRVSDKYDPLPVGYLTKITSNQPITNLDVEAVYNEETRKFWLKKAPNRSYTIEYTGMDASGNIAVTTSTIWAVQ